MRFILNWIVTSISIAIAAALVPGIAPFGPVSTWVAFASAGLFLAIVNSLVKPVVTLISLPATILTLGIFQLVVNSLMLSLAGWLSVSVLGAGIAIYDFGAAFLGSIVVSILCTVLGTVMRD